MGEWAHVARVLWRLDGEPAIRETGVALGLIDRGDDGVDVAHVAVERDDDPSGERVHLRPLDALDRRERVLHHRGERRELVEPHDSQLDVRAALRGPDAAPARTQQRRQGVPDHDAARSAIHRSSIAASACA